MGAKGGSQQTDAMQADQDALVKLAQGQAANADKLFGASFPGFQKAESLYSSLASGDPYAIARATAPVAQQSDQAAGAAKKNILQNGPAGGEKNLALENVDVNRGAAVGDAAAKGYLNSFNALAALSGQGVGESQTATSTAMSGFGSAANIAGQQQQFQVEQKGNSLGALSSLGGDAATLGGGALASKGGEAALAAFI